MTSLRERESGSVIRAIPATPFWRAGHVIQAARHHSVLLLLTFLGISAGAVITALLQPPRYDGRMTLLLKRHRVDPIVSSQGTGAQEFRSDVGEEELNSEVELIRSYDVLRRVVLDQGLQNRRNTGLRALLPAGLMGPSEDSAPEEVRIQRASAALHKSLGVEVVRKTNFISVHYISTDRDVAAKVLKSLATAYLDKHVAVHRPPGALEFFHQQLVQYRGRLAEAEQQLVEFTRGTGVVDTALEKPIVLQKFAEFTAALRQTEAELEASRHRVQALQQIQAATPSRMTTAVRNTDDAPFLSQLRTNLLALEQKRIELLTKFEPSYRSVQEVDAEIAQTRATLVTAEKAKIHEETTDRDPAYEWVRQELAKAESDLTALEAKAKVDREAVESYQKQARALEERGIVQDNLVRTVKSAESNYQLYVQKEEEARIAEALDRGKILNVAIAEGPFVPLTPVTSPYMTAIFGVLLALFVSAGLGFVAEAREFRIRTIYELEAALDIPVLAAIPAGSGGSLNGDLDRGAAIKASPLTGVHADREK